MARDAASQQTAGEKCGLRPTASELGEFRDLIQQLTGLHFDDWRLGALETALLARMSMEGARDAQSYLRMLTDSAHRADELGELLNQLTVNETYFFRYPAQFDFLRQCALPTLLEKRRREGAPVRIWSAGCSTGEEPYSIAMAALDVLGPASADRVEIFGTDVSSAALGAAREVEYRERSLRLLDAACRARHFQQLPEGRFALCDGVRRMVLFSQSSVLDDACKALASWDIIFCRNVLIYFTQEAVRKILDGFLQCLKDDGFLFVGHSEIVDRGIFVPCEREGIFVYQKMAGKPAGIPPTDGPAATVSPIPPVQPEAAVAARDDPEALFGEALDSFGREDYERCRRQLDRLLKQSPRHLRGTLLRANACLSLGEHDRSVQECNAALQIDPFASEACLLLGMNFRQLSRPELALAEMKKAAYISPESCVIQFHLAEAYRTCEMWDRARRAYRNALTLLPSADERDVRAYAGGFGKSALRTLCEQMLRDRN